MASMLMDDIKLSSRYAIEGSRSKELLVVPVFFNDKFLLCGRRGSIKCGSGFSPEPCFLGCNALGFGKNYSKH